MKWRGKRDEYFLFGMRKAQGKSDEKVTQYNWQDIKNQLQETIDYFDWLSILYKRLEMQL